MRHPVDGSLPGRGRPLRASVAVLALSALLFAACGEETGDDDSGGSDDGGSSSEAESTDLLGPEDVATGEPVRIGMMSDGATQAFDNTDELRAAEATAAYWNQHRGGIGGHEIEVVPCETGAEPAGATDCANRFVEEEVVAVTLSQSAVTASAWEPLHAAGVPTFWFQAGGDVATDDQSSFLIFNPELTLFGLPMSVAETEEADKITFVVIDVPQALETLDDAGPIMEEAGLEYEIVPIPVGTADMTSQMQQVADSGSEVVQVVGNDAFCIAAFNGLEAVGFEGAVTSITQCITDATREAVAGDVLEGIFVTSTIALGADDDPTFQLYEEIVDTFGEGIQDSVNATAMGGYVAMASLLTSLEELSGDVTVESVIEAIKSMPEADVPGGGGMTFQCGGSADPAQPAVCTNQSLRTALDTEGQPTEYEVVD
jgi:branched-chain amino acid transport system substrate-binding protein